MPSTNKRQRTGGGIAGEPSARWLRGRAGQEKGFSAAHITVRRVEPPGQGIGTWTTALRAGLTPTVIDGPGTNEPLNSLRPRPAGPGSSEGCSLDRLADGGIPYRVRSSCWLLRGHSPGLVKHRLLQTSRGASARPGRSRWQRLSSRSSAFTPEDGFRWAS